MKGIKADFALLCDEDFTILKEPALVFDEKIVEIGEFFNIKQKYPNIIFNELEKNTLLMPGLINPHTHLEYCASSGLLEFGDFITWLNSVIKNRDELQDRISDEIIEDKLKELLSFGTTAIGAISSFGLDLNPCTKTPLHVTFFTELLGSRPDSVDILFDEFKQRLRAVFDKSSQNLTPALSIHSPYSTHPILAKNALDIAKKENMVVSTHFMESLAEREWLDKGEGDFAKFFKSFSPYSKPFCSGMDFLTLFKDVKTLFTHCVFANEREFDFIKNIGGSITHCPVSNRLLGSGKISFQKLKKMEIPLNIGTDGLSSNYSLNLWDELRAALMLHYDLNLNSLAKELLLSVTKEAAYALNLNEGSLKVGKDATFIALSIPKTTKENLPIQTILHTKKAKKVYIKGEEIDV